MLSYDEEEGILWLHPVFAAITKQVPDGKQSIIVTIDDCDCEDCDQDRGPVDMVSTLLIHFPTDAGIAIQRLSAKEARALGNVLVDYANDLLDFNEALDDER